MRKRFFSTLRKLERVSTITTVIVATPIVFIGIPGLVLAVPTFLKWLSALSLVNRLSVLDIAAKFLGAVFLGLGARHAWKTLETSREGQITDRFSRAIEQLGNENLTIRLGGIYALERIAKDSERDHWTVMEVLASFIRHQAEWQQAWVEPEGDYSPFRDEEAEESLNTLWKPATDVQAALTVISRREYVYDRESAVLDLSGINLRMANLCGADLEHADLSETHLDNADLTDTCLNYANLKSAHLRNAKLEGAKLKGAFMLGCDLYGARGLTLSQLQQAQDPTHARLPRELEDQVRTRLA